MIPFAEINQEPTSYSMLQHIGRIAVPKFGSRNYFRYLQTTLIMEQEMYVSLRIYVRYCLKKPEKSKGVWKSRALFSLKLTFLHV